MWTSYSDGKMSITLWTNELYNHRDQAGIVVKMADAYMYIEQCLLKFIFWAVAHQVGKDILKVDHQ